MLPETALLTEVSAPVSLLLIYGFLLDKKRHQRPIMNTLTEPLVGRAPEPVPVLSCSEKLTAMKGTLWYVVPLYIGVFSQWLVSQSVVTTMAFPNSLFHPRDLYQFYMFAFLLGNFISRSYRLIASLVNQGSNFLIRPTWIVTLTLVAILAFLSTATWYRTPPSTWMVGGLLLLQGLLGGVLYTSTFSVVGENKEAGVKEFCRAFTTVASVGGAVTAGFLGLYFERLFVEHCVYVERHLESCYTRVVGRWNTTKSCDW